MPAKRRPIVVMSIELANGDRHVFGPIAKPAHWRSWVMQQLPYGTAVLGARWSIVSAERPS